jgi:hypothetical protein
MPHNTTPANRSKLNVPKWTRNILFLAVGITLVIASALFQTKNQSSLQAIALNLGLVTIAVVLVEWLWQLCGGTPVENQVSGLSNQIERLSKAVDVIENSKRIGLESVYDRLGNYGNQSDWINLINTSVDSVDLMGRTMFGWTHSGDLKDVILTKIKRDTVSFRWLIMHKDNKYLSLLVEEDKNIGAILIAKLELVYKALWEIRDALPTDMKSLFQVRLFAHVPLYCSIFRVDDKHYVTQYLFSASSDNSPLYCVKGDAAWPKFFAQEFAAIWETSQDFFTEMPRLTSPPARPPGSAAVQDAS